MKLQRDFGLTAGGLLVAASMFVVILACAEPAPVARQIAESAPDGTSRLWGRDGELWFAESRLPDFSYAGYGQGEKPIPEPAVVADVTDFGAVGDGKTDDSEAFLAAIDAVDSGAIFIPEGRYRISKVLRIKKSGVVLRGAGREQTVLFVPEPLYEVEGVGPQLSPYGPYGWSWSGGFIWAEGPAVEEQQLASITSASARGDRSVEVSSVERLQKGQMVRIVQYESDGSLTLHLHGGHPLSGLCLIDRPDFKILDWAVRVEAIEGDRLVFDRPLRVDVRPEWRAEVQTYTPSLREVGVERLTVEFPPTQYNGHHKEPGYNAILFHGVFNGWVRDVEVVNFDSAIHFWYSRFTTGRGVRLSGRGGHYGLNLGGCQDCLMTDFTIENQSVHDTSMSNLGNGNVFSNGRGPNINFDHHRGAAYENLYSNIDVGNAWKGGRRIFLSSGTPTNHYTAARETFWNLRPRVLAKRLPPWPQINIIGRIRGLDEGLPETTEGWLENVRKLEPEDLHAAQLARRLGPPAEDAEASAGAER